GLFKGGQGRASPGDPDLRVGAGRDGGGGADGGRGGRRHRRHQLRVPGAEGDEDRRRSDAAGGSGSGLGNRRGGGGGRRRPRGGEDAARFGGRVACMSRRRTATGRGRRGNAHVATAFGEA